MPGAPAVVYDVLRSPVPSDFMAMAACAASDIGPGTSLSDPATPPIGEVFFYLVRAQNGCPAGEGLLGSSSAGAPRSGRACP